MRLENSPQVAKEMARYKLNIMGMNEVPWNTFGENKLPNGELFIFSRKKREEDTHEHGVAPLLSQEAKRSVMEWEPDEIIIKARVDAKTQKITIVQWYALTNDAEETVKESFYNKLE